MKPFPFAIWPNFIKKGMEEDLRPLVDKLNSGDKRVAHEDWQSAKVAQHLSGMQVKNEQEDPAQKKYALIALHHRLKNLHGVQFSDPGLLQVPDSARQDMGTLASLARIGGVKLAENKPLSGAAYRGSDFYMHGTKSPEFFQSGGVLDPKFFADTGGALGPGLYTENVNDGKAVASAGESPVYAQAGAFGFRMNPKARVVSEDYPFSEDEQKKLFSYLTEARSATALFSPQDITTPSVLRSLVIPSISSLALSTIGIDAIKDSQQQGRTLILPHAVHNMGVVGKFDSHPDNFDLEQLSKPVPFTNKKPPAFAGPFSFLQQVAPRLFPSLADRGTQNDLHQGSSVLEHTMRGIAHLNTDGLDDRKAQLLKLAWSLHDVGKTEGATDEDHPRKSVAVAKQYLDAQQRNAFQLTDAERRLVEHLMTWHDVFGHVLSQLPKQQDPDFPRLDVHQWQDVRENLSDEEKDVLDSMRVNTDLRTLYRQNPKIFYSFVQSAMKVPNSVIGDDIKQEFSNVLEAISKPDGPQRTKKIDEIMEGPPPSFTDKVRTTKDIFTQSTRFPSSPPNIFVVKALADLLRRMWVADINSTPGLIKPDSNYIFRNIFDDQHGLNHKARNYLDGAAFPTTQSQGRLVQDLIDRVWLPRQGFSSEFLSEQQQTAEKSLLFPFAVWPQGLRK